jgi:hypothetical protein
MVVCPEMVTIFQTDGYVFSLLAIMIEIMKCSCVIKSCPLCHKLSTSFHILTFPRSKLDLCTYVDTTMSVFGQNKIMINWVYCHWQIVGIVCFRLLSLGNCTHVLFSYVYGLAEYVRNYCFLLNSKRRSKLNVMRE